MKISKRTREQAWLICAIAASNPSLKHGAASAAFGLGLISRDGPMQLFPHRELISAAFVEAGTRSAATSECGCQDWIAQMAEAAALLAEGWCPP